MEEKRTAIKHKSKLICEEGRHLEDCNFKVVLVNIYVDTLAVSKVNLTCVTPAVATTDLGGFNPIAAVMVNERRARPSTSNNTIILSFATSTVCATKAEGQSRRTPCTGARGIGEGSTSTNVHLLTWGHVLVVVAEAKANSSGLVDFGKGTLGNAARVNDWDVETANVNLVLSRRGAMYSNFEVVFMNIDVDTLTMANINLAGVTPTVAAADGGRLYPVATIVVDKGRTGPSATNNRFILGLATTAIIAAAVARVADSTVCAAKIKLGLGGTPFARTGGITEMSTATDHELFTSTNVLGVITHAETDCRSSIDFGITVLWDRSTEGNRNIEAANIMISRKTSGTSNANFQIEFVKIHVDTLAVSNVNLAGVTPAVATAEF